MDGIRVGRINQIQVELVLIIWIAKRRCQPQLIVTNVAHTVGIAAVQLGGTESGKELEVACVEQYTNV